MSTLWYPPGEGWIEWSGGENPVPGKHVEVLIESERRLQDYWPQHPTPSENFNWRSPSLVAYRIANENPTPSIDRSLFGELVEALEQAREEIGEYARADTGYSYNDPTLNALITKAREALK